MYKSFWQRQTADKPLFPDLIWSRPEQRNAAGKLLIIGGNLHAFAAPAEAFVQANNAGIGIARVLLPDALKSIAGRLLETVEYAPSTPSGSFSQKSLGDFLEHASWADAVLLAGDLGRNSETAILLEKFLQKYSGLLVITKDAFDYMVNIPEIILTRDRTLLVPSFAGLQKLASKSGFQTAFTYQMDLLHFIETLHEFSEKHAPFIIVQHHQQMHAAVEGKIVSTPLLNETPIWRVSTAARSSVWWLQNPAKPLESFATSFTENQ